MPRQIYSFLIESQGWNRELDREFALRFEIGRPAIDNNIRRFRVLHDREVHRRAPPIRRIAGPTELEIATVAQFKPNRLGKRVTAGIVIHYRGTTSDVPLGLVRE